MNILLLKKQGIFNSLWKLTALLWKTTHWCACVRWFMNIPAHFVPSAQDFIITHSFAVNICRILNRTSDRNITIRFIPNNKTQIWTLLQHVVSTLKALFLSAIQFSCCHIQTSCGRDSFLSCRRDQNFRSKSKGDKCV